MNHGSQAMRTRSFLRIWEVAFLLETTEQDVRRQIRKGELAAVCTGKYTQVEVGPLERGPGLSPLARIALKAIVERRLTVRQPRQTDDAPTSLEAAIPQLIGGLKR